MSAEDGEEIEGEDERREVAIASTPSLQPGFNPTRISQDQISKLQELHKRRLEVKSKIHKKLKGGTHRSYGKDLKHDDTKHSNTETEHSRATNLKSNQDSTDSSAHQDTDVVHTSQKKRRKLYWGLDTRERWERKANM